MRIWRGLSDSLSKRHLEQRLQQSYLNLQDERGNVESALTLIPLLILFLTVGQVCLSAYSRSVTDEKTQGAIAYSAMGAAQSGGEPISGGGSVEQSFTSPPIALPLPGGGSLLVGERKVEGLSITPLLPGGDAYTSTGVAVQE